MRNEPTKQRGNIMLVNHKGVSINMRSGDVETLLARADRLEAANEELMRMYDGKLSIRMQIINELLDLVEGLIPRMDETIAGFLSESFFKIKYVISKL